MTINKEQAVSDAVKAILSKSDDEIVGEELFQLFGKSADDATFSRDEMLKAMNYSFEQGKNLIEMVRYAEKQAASHPLEQQQAVSGDELLPCRACGQHCQVEVFEGPHIQGCATILICSAHKMFGGKCPADTAYLTMGAWNTRTALQGGE